MANIYKNAFFTGTTTAAVTVYTAPVNGRVLFKIYKLLMRLEVK